MSPQIDSHEQEDATQPRSFKLPFMIFAATAVTLFAAYAGPSSRAASNFCGKACHSMNPAYQTWLRSAHAKTACLDCHGDDRKSNQSIRFVNLSVKHILKERGGLKVAAHDRPIPDSACVRCHEPKRRSKSKGLIIDHRVHRKIGLSCKECHNRTPHENAPKYSPIYGKAPDSAYRDFSSMRDGCWRCHQEGGKFIRSDGKTLAGPYKQGSAVASTKCKTCHANFFMTQLRGNAQKVWLRHIEQPSRWRLGTTHGRVARKFKFAPCLVCHDPQKRCTVCHKGVAMPHDGNWIEPSRHGAAARSTKAEPCRMCHTLQDVPACSANGHHHEEIVDAYQFDLAAAPWKSGKQRHGVVAKATGGRPCWRCHEQSTWCATQCHQGVVMPHGPQWRRVHFQAVGYKSREPSGLSNWPADRAGACQMCHNSDGKNPDWCQACHHRRFYEANPEFKQKGPWFVNGMAHAGKAAGISLDLQTGNVGICVAACHPGRIAFCTACHRRYMDEP